MRPNHLLFAILVSAPFTLAACGGSEVTVQVLRPGAEGELSPEEGRPVQFLPFNRDSVFRALGERADRPEPRIPEDLQTAFDSVAVLQETWRQAESRWGEVRDSLQQLSNRLRGMDPRGRAYAEQFQRWNQLEQRETALNRQRQEAFARFDQLQQTALGRADSVRAVIEAWEDVAFADYATIMDSILEASGRQVYEDTTDASGTVTRRLRGGTWWVHTRLPIPFAELYWNVPIDPAETDTLRLTPENAEQRIRL